MKFYTDFFLDGKYIYHTYYDNGVKKRVKEVVEPFLFIESNKKEDFKTLHGDYVSKKIFPDVFQARKFVKENSDIAGRKLFGSEKYEYNYINEFYPGKLEFDLDTLRVCFADIETAIPAEGGFPEPLTALEPVTAVTIYHKNIGKYYHLACHDVDTKDPGLEGCDVTFYQAIDEKHLLRNLMSLFEEFDFDVITGWNVGNFDMTYLYNRFKLLFGESYANNLSPWGKVEEKSYQKYGKEQKEYEFKGLAILDYLDAYRKFSFKTLESYRLDFVSQEELGVGKFDHSQYESLTEFLEKDPQKYSVYNILDVKRVVDIDKKMWLLSIIFDMAYDAKIVYNDCFSVVHPWDCIATNYLMDRNIVVPFNVCGKHINITGGYVKEPVVGLHKWVASVDAASLYPHIIMLLNIGPDTYVDSIDGVTPDNILSMNNLLEQTKEEGLSISALGSRFRTDFPGIFYQILEEKYNIRSDVKKEMLAFEQKLEDCKEDDKKAELKSEIAKRNSKQTSIKIFLNALFGSWANPGSRYCSEAFSGGITTTGQLIIQYAGQVIDDYINKVCGTVGEKYTIYSDTDSVFFSLDRIVNKYRMTDKEDKEIAQFCAKVCLEAIGPHLDKKVLELGKKLNAYEPGKTHFKTEKISQAGLFVAKKKYVLNVIYNEGVIYDQPKIKVTGLEAVRSNTPAICREFIKDSFSIMMTKKEEELQTFLEEKRKIFFSMGFYDIARATGVSDVPKDLGKGIPMHARAAVIFNKMIDEKDLSKKYRKIVSGDKIRYAYLKMPNPSKSNVIASSDDELPKEFNMDQYIDYETQWEKTVITPVQNVLDHIGWNAVEQSNIEDFF